MEAEILKRVQRLERAFLIAMSLISGESDELRQRDQEGQEGYNASLQLLSIDLQGMRDSL